MALARLWRGGQKSRWLPPALAAAKLLWIEHNTTNSIYFYMQKLHEEKLKVAESSDFREKPLYPQKKQKKSSDFCVFLSKSTKMAKLAVLRTILRLSALQLAALQATKASQSGRKTMKRPKSPLPTHAQHDRNQAIRSTHIPLRADL